MDLLPQTPTDSNSSDPPAASDPSIYEPIEADHDQRIQPPDAQSTNQAAMPIQSFAPLSPTPPVFSQPAYSPIPPTPPSVPPVEAVVAQPAVAVPSFESAPVAVPTVEPYPSMSPSEKASQPQPLTSLPPLVEPADTVVEETSDKPSKNMVGLPHMGGLGSTAKSVLLLTVVFVVLFGLAMFLGYWLGSQQANG